MMPTVELLVWRASLATAPQVPEAPDLDDWATIFATAGETEGAALLQDAATIVRGFPAPRDAPAAPCATIDLLLDELDALAAEFVPSTAPIAPRRAVRHPGESIKIGASAPLPSPSGDLASAATSLIAFLSSPALDDGQDAAAALTWLAQTRARLPGFDYRALRDAPLGELALAIALTALVDFAASAGDLATAPRGSIGLLHRAARLNPQGLGPYLSGVGRVARSSVDVFEFARRAAGTAGGDRFEAWIALLARGCPGALLLDLVDDLGDANQSTVLNLILDHLLSRFAGIDLEVVRRVRDAGLDNADWQLAARAQAAIARLNPKWLHELVILGSIEATGGDFGAAEATFLECLRRAPQDEDAAIRLLAARRQRFDGFEILGGFDTPLLRSEARFRRRGIMPEHAPRHGERLFAVDV
jgi:hypothetical protein